MAWRSEDTNVGERAVVDLIDDLAGVLRAAAVAGVVWASDPAGDDQVAEAPTRSSSAARISAQTYECHTKTGHQAGGRSRLWLCDTLLGSSHLGVVPRDDVVPD